MKIRVILKLCWLLIRHNPIKTIWLNYKILPFKQAKYLPILVCGKCKFRHIYRGGVIIDNEDIRPFMIVIGKNSCYVATSEPKTIWSIHGTLILKGPINFLQGTYVMVAEGAVLTIGSRGTVVGSNTKIMCFDSITIGNSVRITWDCQFYDSSFHYVRNSSGNISKLSKPIVIGNNVWIGNHATVVKGSVLPDFSIVGSHSLVNKDFSDTDGHCLLTGVPATVKAVGLTRIFDGDEENKLDIAFGYTRTHL